MKNPYRTGESSSLRPHPFYKGKLPQGDCKNCGRKIQRDRWTGTGWAHYETADELCGPPQTKAELA